MSVLHLNESEFNAKIPAAPVAMVDFWATWCGPCKMLAPVIDSIAGKYGVMSIPTVIFFKDGKEIDRKVGVQPAGVYTQTLDANL